MVIDASSARRARHCPLLLAAAWALLGLLASAAALAQNTGFDVHIQQVDDNGKPNHLPDELAHKPLGGSKTRFRVYVEAKDPALLPYTINLGSDPRLISRITLSVAGFQQPIDQRVYLSPTVEVRSMSFLSIDNPRLMVQITSKDNNSYSFLFDAHQKGPNARGASVLYTEEYVRRMLPTASPTRTPSPARAKPTRTPTATSPARATATSTATATPALPIAPVTISVQDAVEESPGTWRSNVKFEPGKTVSLAIVIESDDDPATSITIGKLESAEPGFLITKPAVDELRLSPKTEHMFNIRFPDGITAARWSFTATCKITLKTTGKSSNRTVPLPQAGMNINGKFYEKNTAIIGVDYTVTIVFPTGVTSPATAAPSMPPTSAPRAALTQASPASQAATPAIVIDCADTWRVSRDGESEPYSLTIINKTARDIRAIVTFDPPGLVDCDRLAPGGITIRPGFPQIYQLKLSAEGVQRLLQDKSQTLTITATWQQPHPGQATATVNIIVRDLWLIALLVIGGIGLVGALATGAFAWLKREKKDKNEPPKRQVFPKGHGSDPKRPESDNHRDGGGPPGSSLVGSRNDVSQQTKLDATAETGGRTALKKAMVPIGDRSALPEETTHISLHGTEHEKEQPPDRSTPLDKRLTQLEKLVRELWSELDQEKQRANTATQEMQALRTAIQPLLSPDWVRQQLSGAGDELMTELEATQRFSKKLDEIFRASKELPKKNEIRITTLENLSKTYENGLAKLHQSLADKPDRQEADGLRAVLAQMIVSHVRQVEWILQRMNAQKAGESIAVEIDSYRSFLDSILDRAEKILEKIQKDSRHVQDQEVSAKKLERCRKQRTFCQDFFAKALAKTASSTKPKNSAPSPASSADSGSPSLFGGQVKLNTLDALLQYSQQEWDRFNDYVRGVSPEQTDVKQQDAESYLEAFRDEILRTIFVDIAWLLWDVGLAFPNETREAISELLKKLYHGFDVKWIWPMVKTETFNPESHWRVDERPSKYPAHTILEVVQLGVIDRNKVVRQAHVITSRGPV